jgi:hypothetical protein
MPEIFASLDTEIHTEGNADYFVNKLGQQKFKGDCTGLLLKPFTVDEHGVIHVTINKLQYYITVFVAYCRSAGGVIASEHNVLAKDADGFIHRITARSSSPTTSHLSQHRFDDAQ